MADAATLTIRIDPNLKDSLERAASASEQSVTEYVTRAVKEKMGGSCSSCGRGAQSILPAGLTENFKAWVVGLVGEPRGMLHQKDPSNVTIEVHTPEGRRVYWGMLNSGSLQDGLLILHVEHPKQGIHGFRLPIALSEIVSWTADKDQTMYERFVQIGALDGNAYLKARWARGL